MTCPESSDTKKEPIRLTIKSVMNHISDSGKNVKMFLLKVEVVNTLN